MARIVIKNLDQYGELSSGGSSVCLLPPNSFSHLGFMRLKNGYVEPFGSPVQIAADYGSPISRCFSAYNTLTKTGYVLVCKTASVKAGTGGALTDITRTSGGAYTGDDWTGSIFNGVYILNNGVDAPQAWSPIDTSTPLVNLPYWPAGDVARVIRPFKNVLFALDCTPFGATRNPRLVKWSHPADPGAVPTSWVASSTTDAGEVEVDWGELEVVEAVPFGNEALFVYTRDAVGAFTFSGDSRIFNTRGLLPIGAAGPECVVPFFSKKEGGHYHFVVTLDDIVIHNGHSARSLLSNYRSHIYSGATPGTRYFAVLDSARSRILFKGSLDVVYAWDYEYDTWSRLLDYNSAQISPRHMARSAMGYGSLENPGVFWVEQNKTDPNDDRVMEFSPIHAYTMDWLNEVPRAALAFNPWAFYGVGSDGQLLSDPFMKKIFSRIQLHFDAIVLNESVDIGLAVYDDPYRYFLVGGLTWGASYVYPGDVDFVGCGRFLQLGVRVPSSTISSWKLRAVSLEVEPAGMDLAIREP